MPVYCVDEVAEHAIALMLTLARRIATYDASVRSGEWDIRTGTPMYPIAGSTLGVVGFGHIGQAVARRGLGLGMQVIAADSFARPETVAAAGVELVELDALLSASDAVSLHVPLNAETHHLTDAGRLARIKPTAVLINCARRGRGPRRARRGAPGRPVRGAPGWTSSSPSGCRSSIRWSGCAIPC